jgi:hypothetical protein
MSDTAALLELSGSDSGFGDANVRDSLLVAQKILDYKFPIYDTGSDVGTTLRLLDTLYKEGKRIFIGFNRSTMLREVYRWFLQHPNAVGISLTSTAPSLRYAENIYRLSPSGDNTISTYRDWMRKYDRVYILYEPDEDAVVESMPLLEEYAYKSIPITSGTDVLYALSIIPNEPGVLVIPYLVSNMDAFTDHAYQYIPDVDVFEDMSSEPPVLKKGTYVNKYYYLQMNHTDNPTMRSALGDRLSIHAYDAVYLSKYGDDGTVLFNRYNDRMYTGYTIYRFNGAKWVPVQKLSIDV